MAPRRPTAAGATLCTVCGGDEAGDEAGEASVALQAEVAALQGEVVTRGPYQ